MSATPEHTDAVRAAVQDAVTSALNDHGYMPTRWVAIVEVIGNETGERGCWMLTPEDAMAWDTLGLLHYANQVEQAGLVAHHLDGDD